MGDVKCDKAKILFYDFFEKTFFDGYNSANSEFCRDVFLQIDSCQSPIEEIMLVALSGVVAKIGKNFHKHFTILAQHEIENGDSYYVADFAIFFQNRKNSVPIKLIVECDGHEFHEKTKEQVEKRNKRDYSLKMQGFDILHFSGSEIYKDPVGCARKCIDYIITLYKLSKNGGNA